MVAIQQGLRARRFVRNFDPNCYLYLSRSMDWFDLGENFGGDVMRGLAAISLEKALEIVQYELLERNGECYRFRAAGGMHAGAGSAGSLIPPHEYHTIRNTSADAVAVSLHIYKAPMACCSKFAAEDGEWFVREATEMRTDQAA